jgi:dienelactone hydrolase
MNIRAPGRGRGVLRQIAVAALLGLAAGRPASAFAEDLVRFGSATLQPEPGKQPVAGGGAIEGYLTKPKGDGPFPAVVLLHSCLGLPAAKKSIADQFARWGYVALFVDEFVTRGVKDTCAVDFKYGPSDAFGALLYLSKLPYVDAKRIAVVGYSQGADAVLQLASGRFASALSVPRGLDFKAAAAFYPPCENQAGIELTIPTLILIGESDDVTPAADCRRLAKGQSALGSDFKLVVYPGAHHLFDDPGLAGGRRVLGMWLQYDARAAEQSKSEIRDFLAAKLGR